MRTVKSFILFLLLSQVVIFVRGQTKPGVQNGKDTLSVKVDTLKAAIVTAAVRPHLRGDTIEYNTDNVVMRRNAVVEDLLRRLPGLQIDAEGMITYNGQKIEHLLVDGEDVFGNDPTMVTRNFDASKISRVQILDRRSDKAIFTGVDDGVRIKTLNLVMKESSRDGYFGRIEGGGNTDGYHNVNGALVELKGKEQFTALGLAANTGVLGFSSNIGGASSGVGLISREADAMGASAGAGIPKIEAMALHYANIWNIPEDHLNANYQYSHFITQPVSMSEVLESLSNSIYEQNQRSVSLNEEEGHWVHGIYDWTVGKRSAFNFTFLGSLSHGRNQLGSTDSTEINKALVNCSQRTIENNVNHQMFEGDLAYRIRIGTSADRVLAIYSAVKKDDASTNGYLYSLNQYYGLNNETIGTDTSDQKKHIVNHSFVISNTMAYSEPLWKQAKLGFNFGMSVTRNEPFQGTYSGNDGKYLQMVDSLSSHFTDLIFHQQFLVNIQGKMSRLEYTVGNGVFIDSYRQQNLFSGSKSRYRYANWVPMILFNYALNRKTNLEFSYIASTQEPSPEQLQPITNNNDPLHIILGNPDLKPALNQSISLRFNWVGTWLLNVDVNASSTSNDISTKTTIDSLGRQISQPTNVHGGREGTINVSIVRRILGADVGLHTIGHFSRNHCYVNADLSSNDLYQGSAGVSFNKNITDRYSIQFNTNFDYFSQISSVNSSMPLHYWTQSHSGALIIYLVKKFEINTNAVFTWQQETTAFTKNTAVLLWNGSVSRTFLRDRLVGKFQFNNILNNNSSINRSNTGNISSQNSTNILGRYWMLSVAYHFDRKFK